MAEKIALLLKSHFVEYCRPLLNTNRNGCQLTYYPYETIQEMQSIFLEHKKEYDAFLTSGSLALNALKAVDQAPYALKYHFGSYLENTYRLLLAHALERKTITPEHIGIDYLNDSSNLQEMLNQDRLPELLSDFEHSISGLSGEELDAFEHQLVKRYLDQYHQGKLDFVVTNFYSVVEALEKEQVECYYSYPSQTSILQTLELCIKDIALNKMRGNITAVIRVSPPLLENQTSNHQELAMLALKGRIVEYCRTYHCEPILKDDLTDIEIYISKEKLQQMTNHFIGFDLPSYLERETGFKGTVSIGIGENLSAAKLNAVQAKYYAARLNQQVCVYIDENNAIHSMPFTQEHNTPSVGISEDCMAEVANKCHISAETVYRVVSAMQKGNSDCISSFDLIEEEGFSACTATRALKALANAGYAKITGQKRVGNKGRPLNIFQVSLPQSVEQTDNKK